jgi:hypothetical protein
MEDNPSFHSGSLTDQQLEIAKAELMGGGR